MKVLSPEIMEIITHRNEGKRGVPMASTSYGHLEVNPSRRRSLASAISFRGEDCETFRKWRSPSWRCTKIANFFVGFLEDFQRFRLDGLFRIDDRKGATKIASESCQWFPDSSTPRVDWPNVDTRYWWHSEACGCGVSMILWTKTRQKHLNSIVFLLNNIHKTS